ncbi:GerAB/ArcD/ProY family transporter [Garciella nitratireducens]|uniref:Spore germination protein KB n=1 Tax=Garciella nitratireducens DSM 15102 TaxID=1121911 RepID=A0A1T4JSF6_9FIRM|nr:GerAB/ArcD/ProY family transporter [Garciella nitratireducens]SJZ33116.1 spore germination protein KB [Garciella nitratireducens DSM 15102]
MNGIKIDLKQFFSLIVLFELGSAVVLGLATAAKQDAWFAILLAMLGGMILFLCYGYFFKKYPTLILTSYIQILLGNKLGKIIAFCYCGYFIYIASLVLRDFGELMVVSLLPETPIAIINLLTVMLVAYGIYLGIEVLARVGELCFSNIIFLVLLLIVLIFISKLPKIENLQPFLEDGIGTIVKKTYLQTLTFPFGEMIVFTMIFPLINKPSSVVKTAQVAILTSGILLSLVMMINQSVQGTYITHSTPFPLLKTVSRIHIGNVIQRLDIIAVIVLIVGIFFNMSIYLYAAVSGLTDIFSIENHKKFIPFVSIITLILSLIIGANFSSYEKISIEITSHYIHIPFQIIIPLILMGIAYFKNHKRSS